MQVPILNGIYTTENADFRTAYPVNMMPVPKESGISSGYLRPVEGIVAFATGPGVDRGAWNYKGVCYRVMGDKLVKISESGVVTELATVPGTDEVVFDQSFSYMSICADGKLYHWTGAALAQVTDTDLGVCLDMIWVDGYYMTTDGSFIVVTELTNPFAANPLKYGSSEADPDTIVALLKLRDEPVVLNRYTVEFFENVGGDNFPFQRITGAMLMRGVIGRDACCVMDNSIAFLGGARDEQPAIWMGANGGTTKISTDEIDKVLESYTEEQLATTVFERRVLLGFDQIWVRLPDRTLVYDAKVSAEVQEHAWFYPSSNLNTAVPSQYRMKNSIWCYNKWLIGDTETNRVGYLSKDVASHWGETVGFEFSTQIIYADGKIISIDSLELVGLPGRAAYGVESTIWTSYSNDGETWSTERPRSAGVAGERRKRLVWRKQGVLRNYRLQKFRGTSDAMLSVARLEMEVSGG